MKSDLSKIKVEVKDGVVRFSAPLDQVSREHFEAVVRATLRNATREMIRHHEAEIIGNFKSLSSLFEEGTHSVPAAGTTATRSHDAGRSPVPLPLPEKQSKTPPRRMAGPRSSGFTQPRGRTRRNGRAT